MTFRCCFYAAKFFQIYRAHPVESSKERQTLSLISYTICVCFKKKVSLKGTVARDFRPSVFSSINNNGPPDSWAKAVSNINSYSGRYSIMKIDSTLCYIVWSRFLVLAIQKLFYFLLQTIGREDPIWMVFVRLLLYFWLQRPKVYGIDSALCKINSAQCYIARKQFHQNF
jgi:hypothetical protein